MAGTLIGWTTEAVPLESLGAGNWARSLALAALAAVVPIAGAAAMARDAAAPVFAELLGPREGRVRDPLARLMGWLLIATVVLAMESALALTFDPRYRDFPFAPLTAAVLPFLLIRLMRPRLSGGRPLAETLAAAVLLACAAFVVWNETLANWQALWFAAAAAALAVSLLRAPAAPGSG